MNFYKNMSIRQKLLMLFSIQIIIPLIFMGVMIYRTSSEIIERKSIDYSVDILKMIELRFNDFSDNVQVAASDILYDPVIYALLEAEDKAQSDEEMDLTQIEVMNNILRKVCLSRDEIQAIAIIADNRQSYTYDSNTGRVDMMADISYDQIHDRATAGKGQLVWYVSETDSANQQVFALRSIYNIDDYEEIGLMVIMIKIDELEAVYGNLSTEFMERITLVTQEGDYIVGTSEPEKVRLNMLSALDESSLTNYYIDEEANVLVSFRDVITPPWRIITEISLDKLNEDMNSFRNYFLMISALTLLILSLLSLFVAMDIVEPIKRLVSAMSRMKKEKTHDVIEVDRQDELGYLSNSFNEMSEEIDILLNQVYREQLTRKEAELKTLQAQINPHFLFNTLESINWMARLNEVPQISEMVTALSSLMEAGIGKGGPKVALQDELNFVESYILIMKNRYGERLTFKKDIDESCLSVKVPKLILQPILENAIYHGIDKIRGNGYIHLTIKRKQEKICIQVEDSGKGISDQRLETINRQLLANNLDELGQEASGLKGIGLTNVNRRIKLFYGDDYGLDLSVSEDQHVVVTITLPENG